MSKFVKMVCGMVLAASAAVLADEGQEPGFVLHDGNVVRCADNSVQIWAKIGYKGTNGVVWADEAIIKYRIDSVSEGTSRVSGVTAVSSSTAHAASGWTELTTQTSMSMQSLVADDSGKGRAMMWMATVTDDLLADPDSVLVYEIYARNNSGTAEWKQAEYNANDGDASTFEYRMWSYGSDALTVDGVPADYTTSKFFIDEDANESVSVKVEYTVPDGAEAVEVFTNFGRRDYADADVDKDGQPDALVPPDRDSVTSDNCSEGYWQAIAMDNVDGVYTATLTTTNCGVYRITARYRAAFSEGWTWYSDGPNGAERRDHVVVISPKKAKDAIIYELDSIDEAYTNLAEKLAVNTLRFEAQDSAALEFASLCDSASLDTILSCAPSAYPSNLVENTSLDGLSCTSPTNNTTLFWEYCINRARKAKWDFLFMANVPEGGETGFLCNRLFDILEETIVFRFTEDHVSYAAQLQAALVDRRAAYGNGLVLLNEGSTAEPLDWSDPQCVVSRYAMLAAMDGVPMMFHDQETTNTTSESAPNNTSAMTALYKRINLARQNSPALRSQNRYLSGGNSKILFCAKWEEDGANPNVQDSVFAAALFLNDSMDGALNGHWGDGQWYNISPFAAKMGIENRADRYYNVVNVASTSSDFLWDTPRSGRDLYENQLYLGLKGSWKWEDYTQTTEYLACSEWGDNGYVVQYLKVVDVTDETTPWAPDGLTINDPNEAISLDYTNSYNVVGMAGEDLESNVTWSNALTGVGGTFSPSTVWTNSVPLEVGTNVITFSAATAAPENSFAVLASVSGAESVEGFEDFVDTSSSGNGGYFVHTSVNDIDLSGFTGDTAFALWANLGCSATVTRYFTEADTLTSVSVDVGMLWDSNIDGKYKGVEFMDGGDNPVFGVRMGSNSTVTYYGANGASGTWSEDNGNQVFTITLTKTETGFAVTGTTRSGDAVSEIEIESDADICTFKAFMDGVDDEWSDGVNLKDKRALYFDNLRYTVPASDASTSTATATIVVLPPTATQTTPVSVPYSWFDGYLLGDGSVSGYETAATSMAANGLNSVWVCYVIGLDPTNATSKFTATISFDADGNPVIGFDPARPAHTPVEWYKVQGKTNLGDSWSTKSDGHRFFRVLMDIPDR